MRLWDLSGGSARLEQAMDALKKKTAEIGERWNDPAFKDLHDTYLLPLEPKVLRALDAIHRLEEVLSRAQRDCGDY